MAERGRCLTTCEMRHDLWCIRRVMRARSIALGACTSHPCVSVVCARSVRNTYRQEYTAQLWRCLSTALNRCVWVRVGGQLGCESGGVSVSWGSEWWRSGSVTVLAIFMFAYLRVGGIMTCTCTSGCRMHFVMACRLVVGMSGRVRSSGFA